MKKIIIVIVVFLMGMTAASKIIWYQSEIMLDTNDNFYSSLIKEKQGLVKKKLEENPEMVDKIMKELEKWEISVASKSFLDIISEDEYEDFIKTFMNKYDNWKFDKFKNMGTWLNVEDFKL